VDWKSQLEEVLRGIPGYDPWCQAADAWLDHDEALRRINWFPEHLRHVEGDARGLPFVLRRWQAAIIGNLFGWKRKDSAGRIVRRYRKAFILAGKGCGKTPLVAGICLCSLDLDGEAGAQDYLAAGAKEQAGFLFRNAKGFVDQDEHLQERFRVYGGGGAQGGAKSIVDREDLLSSLKVVAADANTQHGGIPHLVAIDEVHAQKTRDLIDLMEAALGKKARSQPLLLYITNKDFDRPSICNELDDYAHKVRDNGGNPDRPGYDPEFLPVLYELGPEDDWEDETLWPKALPNLDSTIPAEALKDAPANERGSVSMESIRKLAAKAKAQPSFENEFRRLILCQRVSQNVRIVPMREWDECAKLELVKDDLLGRRCFAGFDLASTEDLASFALLFPLAEERLAALWWIFCPEEKVIARAKMRIPYDVWDKAGHIIATPGNQIDYETIETTFATVRSQYDVVEAGFDPYQAVQMQQRMMTAYGETFVYSVPQNINNLSAPFKYILRAVKKKQLAHFNQPVARWAASNVAGYFKGRIPAGSKLEDHLDKVPVMPSKQLSADKIDPITALVTAAARMLANPDAGESDGPTVMVI
jgi:phage terminase large subunit-like protein